MRSYLDFEKPVAELEAKVEELRAMQAGGDAIAISEEINRIEGKAAQALEELYGHLRPGRRRRSRATRNGPIVSITSRP